MKQYNVGAPFERIAMDIAGPFPVTDNGNKYIMIIADYFTKWTEAFAIPNQEAETVANEFVYNWVCRFGVPLELHSDQGRNFESQIFKEMCRVLKINKTRTTPLHPQSDGMVERFNRTLEQALSKTVDSNQNNWDQAIQPFMLAYRSAVHDTTSFTPFRMLIGREARLPCDLEFGIPEQEQTTVGDYAYKLRHQLQEIHEIARGRIKLASGKMKTRYDLRANSVGFQENDLVWFYNPKRRIGKSPKLQPDWEGPFTIITRINDVVYRIQKYKSPRAKMKVVHLDRSAHYSSC